LPATGASGATVFGLAGTAARGACTGAAGTPTGLFCDIAGTAIAPLSAVNNSKELERTFIGSTNLFI